MQSIDHSSLFLCLTQEGEAVDGNKVFYSVADRQKSEIEGPREIGTLDLQMISIYILIISFASYVSYLSNLSKLVNDRTTFFSPSAKPQRNHNK